MLLLLHKPVIESKINGLVIQAAPDIVLSSSYQTCLDLGGPTTLSGAPLTVTSGSMAGRGIYLNTNVSLLVSDMALTVQGGRFGIQGASGSGKLVLSDANVTASCTKYPVAAIRVPGGISLSGCEIVSPAGGSVKDGTVVGLDEAAAPEVVITPLTHVTGVTLDQTALTLVAGESGMLTASVAPEDAADRAVTWESSAPKVTAKAPGTADVTVKTTDGGMTAVCAVTVVQGVISVSGETMTYSVYLPGSGAPATLIAAWYDENEKVLGCTVEDNVKQNGLKTGTIEDIEKNQKEYRLFALDGGNAAPLLQALTIKE